MPANTFLTKLSHQPCLRGSCFLLSGKRERLGSISRETTCMPETLVLAFDPEFFSTWSLHKPGGASHGVIAVPRTSQQNNWRHQEGSPGQSVLSPTTETELCVLWATKVCLQRQRQQKWSHQGPLWRLDTTAISKDDSLCQ